MIEVEKGKGLMVEVDSASKATEIAVDFVKKYRLIARPTSAQREGEFWIVKVDVGAFFVIEATVKIEASTGRITEYLIPPPGPLTPPPLPKLPTGG